LYQPLNTYHALRAAIDKHDNGARSAPSSEIMPKHDEASGGIGKKIIGG
jgi:hypothetical protein